MDIKLTNICKQYGKHTVFKDLNIDLSKGNMISIIGPSGSGKTTLLNMLGTLTKPTGGEIIIDGKSITVMKSSATQKFRSEYISYIFQDYNLINNLSLFDNLKLTTDKSNAEIESMLDKLGIIGCRDNLPDQMSGGECQRAAIARALLRESKIILCDEPTGALDVNNRKLIIEILQDISQAGTKVIIVTHDIDCTLNSDITHILTNGRITARYQGDQITEEQIYQGLRGER